VKTATFLLLLISTSVFSQSLPTSKDDASGSRLKQRIYHDRIWISPQYARKNVTIQLNKPQRIRVNGSVVEEVEYAFKKLYNIENELINIRVGSRKRQFLNLTTNIGIKGWETSASAKLYRKAKNRFDIQYRFSVEDMLMNDLGHRIMLSTKF
jgi:hypothetical protein